MITVRECKYEDRKRYNELEGEYHYMGESHGAGDTVRLIFEEDGEWVGLMTWAAACYALKPRDERIGWNHAMRRLRLKLVVNNRRFCIVAPKGARPNLASQLLGLAIRELPAIWKAKWGYVPLLAETFCDIERVAGTCYRAAGWEEVGKTKGFTRSRHTRDFYIPNGRCARTPGISSSRTTSRANANARRTRTLTRSCRSPGTRSRALPGSSAA